MSQSNRLLARLVPAAALAAALALPLVTGACAGMPVIGPDEPDRVLTEDELAGRLAKISEAFSRTAQSAADAATAQGVPPELERRVLAWRLQSVKALREAVISPDAQGAFLDAWAFLVQQRQYFGSASAKEYFGPAAAKIRDGIAACEKDLVALGGEFLDAEQLQRAREEVEAFAKANPMSDAFARSGNVPAVAHASESSRLDWLVAVPMAPFKVFSGIDEGAAAIRDFSAVADRFAQRIDQIPQETAWELQLILHDTENGPAAQRTLGGLEEFAAASTSIAATAKDLPAELRRALDDSFAQLDERHARLNASIQSAEDVVARANDALKSAEKPLADAAVTAESLGRAGEAWDGAIQSFRGLYGELSPPVDPTAPPPASTARPFDIREYEKTAAELAGTARELHGAIESLRGLLKDADTDATTARIAKMTRETAAAARAEGEALADHVFVRALMLAAAVTLLAVAGVLVVRRWGRR